MGSFFFQAEDGIRDDLVTGVQTCALPISKTVLFLTFDENGGFFDHVPPTTAPPGTPGEYVTATAVPDPKIGRASCRERVWVTGTDGRIRKTKRFDAARSHRRSATPICQVV